MNNIFYIVGVMSNIGRQPSRIGALCEYGCCSAVKFLESQDQPISQ
jgi:hypothetical protein